MEKFKIKYRPEIDGLRAIGAVPLAIYHAGITYNSHNIMPGGFVSVDIFSSSKLNKSSKPGKIISITEDGVLISAKDGSVLIKEMKSKNNPKMPSGKLLKELGIKVGDKFDDV